MLETRLLFPEFGARVSGWRRASALGLVLLVFFSCAVRAASVRLARIVAQDGAVPTYLSFTSYTPSRRQLARGDYARKPVTVSGRLLVPREMPAARLPGVVLMHGSDGVSDLQGRYAADLVRHGMAVLILDSFSPRGVESTIGSQSAVPTHALVMDLFQALRALGEQPRIDARRISVIGWSKGGTAALWAARQSYQRLIAGDLPAFAAHVAFYPWCGEQAAEIALSGTPLLLLTAGADDWTGARACSDYVARARAAGYDATISVFPEARHGFDYAGTVNRFLPQARDWSDCRYLASEAGFQEIPSGLFRPWTELDLYFAECSRPGAHAATNSRARARSLDILHQFLARVLGK